MKRRSHKIITRVIVFLLLGAIVNVAVAWGCASLLDANKVKPARVTQESIVDGYTLWETLYTWKRQGLNRVERLYGFSYSVNDNWQLVRPFPPERPRVMLFAGWPLYCLECQAFGVGMALTSGGVGGESNVLVNTTAHAITLMPPQDGTFATWRGLPCKPRTTAFAINTVFYAVILWLLFFAPRSVRRTLRRKRGLCPACAYPVGTSPVCTECGNTVKRSAVSDQRSVTKNQS